MKRRILTINPGSTSTKAVLFENDAVVRTVELEHTREDMARYQRVMDQLQYRTAGLRAGLGDLGPLDAVVGRGGFLAPVPGGVFAINEAMLDVLRQASYGEHASNLGAFLAKKFADKYQCPALVVDPVATDELMDSARLTGLPEISRRTIFHALGQRGAARDAASRLGIDYGHGRFIVAHLGGGISVGAHLRGRVVDVTNAMDGEGPFSPERSGTLPLLSALRLIESGRYSIEQLKTVITKEAGLLAHLGTSDLRQVEARMNSGDEKAKLVFEAMVYNIAKAVASMAPALEGRVEAVVITGGMARSTRLTHELTRLVAYLGPVVVVTGVEEMRAMARGAFLALDGELEIQAYPPKKKGDASN